MSYDFLVLSYNGSIKVEDYLTICLYLDVPLSRCLSALVFIFWCNRGVCFLPSSCQASMNKDLQREEILPATC